MLEALIVELAEMVLIKAYFLRKNGSLAEINVLTEKIPRVKIA